MIRNPALPMLSVGAKKRLASAADECGPTLTVQFRTSLIHASRVDLAGYRGKPDRHVVDPTLSLPSGFSLWNARSIRCGDVRQMWHSRKSWELFRCSCVQKDCASGPDGTTFSVYQAEMLFPLQSGSSP
jgi:hypothetical protein